MRLLLDTHAFLFWITDSEALSESARGHIEDPENELYLSAASGWEIAIKTKLKRLELTGPPERVIAEQMAFNHIQSLSIQMSHALNTYHLPQLHRDPFDRMLVAQSMVEEIPILTRDPAISQYKVETIW
jgi:PIN domain nuclease of toxin-antitoxin system